MWKKNEYFIPNSGVYWVILIVLISLIVPFVMASCSTASASQYEEAPRRFVVTEYSASLDVVTDRETGVQYLTRYKGGITPLLNADGTLYIAGQEDE